MTESGLTYRDAGVDIDAGDALVERIKPLVKRTMRPEVLAGIGGFGALFEVPLDRYRKPVLVSGTDGVGTKLKLAIDTGRHDTIGIDLVAMCVNDVARAGRRAAVLPRLLRHRQARVDVAEAVIGGIAEGCELAGCALIGGETAEMPGMYPAASTTSPASASAWSRSDRIIDGTQHRGRRRGDRPRLLRPALERLLADPQAGVGRAAPTTRRSSTASRCSTACWTPTRIYVKPLLALAQKIDVQGLRAHHRRRPHREHSARAARRTRGACCSGAAGARDPVFDWLAATGKIAAAEMYRTFNCGIGMIVVVAPADVDAALAQLAATRRNRQRHRRRRARHARRGHRGMSACCRSPWSFPAAAATWKPSRAPRAAGGSRYQRS